MLNCPIKNGNLSNHITQSFFSHHSLQNFISSFSLHFSFLTAAIGDSDIIIIAFNTVSNSLHHFIVSFNPGDIYIKGMLPKTAEEICALWGTEFQIVYPLFEQKLLRAF